MHVGPLTQCGSVSQRHRKCLQFSSMGNIYIRSLIQLQPPLLPPKAGRLFTSLSLKSRNLANSHMIRPCLIKSRNLALYLWPEIQIPTPSSMHSSPQCAGIDNPEKASLTFCKKKILQQQLFFSSKLWSVRRNCCQSFPMGPFWPYYKLQELVRKMTTGTSLYETQYLNLCSCLKLLNANASFLDFTIDHVQNWISAANL